MRKEDERCKGCCLTGKQSGGVVVIFSTYLLSKDQEDGAASVLVGWLAGCGIMREKWRLRGKGKGIPSQEDILKVAAAAVACKCCCSAVVRELDEEQTNGSEKLRRRRRRRRWFSDFSFPLYWLAG